MFVLFIDHFDGKEFDSLEDYYDEVSRYASGIEEELGRAERWAKQDNPDVLDELGVTIKGVNDGSEDD